MSAPAAAEPLTIEPFPRGRDQPITGECVCPPDKSVTHRSVMFASMAQGESLILSPLMGADCRSTMGVFRALGATLDEGEGAVRVVSPGWDGLRSPELPLDFGNSGTTARLLTGVFSASEGLFVTCFGDASLSKRPMGRVVTPLRRVGARIMGREDGRLMPLAILGSRLQAGEHVVDKASAQVKSALLLAGLNIAGTTVVRLPGGSRDHTEKMLKAMGATLSVAHGDDGSERIEVRGPFRPMPRRYKVPGDPSSAAFLAVLAALSGGTVRIRAMLDNPTRTGFVKLLERFGAHVAKSGPLADPDALEPMVDLTVTGGRALEAVDMEAAMAPSLIDEVPILSVVALFAKGTSRFRGLSELRVKESDRLAKTIELLKRAGGEAYAEGDDLIVQGGMAQAKRFRYAPDWDHRLAMAAAVLAKFADGPCVVEDPDCVRVSFPGFFDVLSSLR